MNVISNTLKWASFLYFLALMLLIRDMSTELFFKELGLTLLMVLISIAFKGDSK